MSLTANTINLCHMVPIQLVCNFPVILQYFLKNGAKTMLSYGRIKHMALFRFVTVLESGFL